MVGKMLNIRGLKGDVGSAMERDQSIVVRRCSHPYILGDPDMQESAGRAGRDSEKPASGPILPAKRAKIVDTPAPCAQDAGCDK
jgi:hypothetical protein